MRMPKKERMCWNGLFNGPHPPKVANKEWTRRKKFVVFDKNKLLYAICEVNCLKNFCENDKQSWG
jgi:hypothetical protein